MNFFSWHLVSFFLFGLAAELGQTSPAPWLPDYDYVGSGFQVLLGGDFVGEVTTTPVRAQVIELQGRISTPDERWSIPLGVTVRETPGCVLEVNTVHKNSLQKYQHSSANNIKLSVGYGELFSSSLSTSWKSIHETQTSMDSYMYTTYAKCDTYTVEFKPYIQLNITESFRNGVASLPESFDSSNPDLFNMFIDAFGTHFSSGISFGGSVKQTCETTVNKQSAMDQHGLDIDAEATIKFKVDIGVDVGHKDDTTTHKEFEQSITSSGIISEGGVGIPSSANNFSEWSKSLAKEPVPVAFSLKPLASLLTSDIFPTQKNIKETANALAQATTFYLQTQGTLGAMVPVIETCTSEKGQYQSSCTAVCEEDMVSVSGGCISGDLSVGNWPWRLLISKPNEDYSGWICTGGQDKSSNVYYQSVVGFAVCLPAVVKHSNFPHPGESIAFSNTLTSQTSWAIVQRYGSSAMAVCPKGTIMTGGGCDAVGDNSYTNWPWRLTNNYPSSTSTWECKAGEDESSYVYNQKFRAFALCSKFISTLKYVQLPPRTQVIHSTSGTDQRYQNSCEVRCPRNTLVLGGGCSTQISGFWPWRISASFPHENGWRCVAGQDKRVLPWGSPEHQVVTCYALCMNMRN